MGVGGVWSYWREKDIVTEEVRSVLLIVMVTKFS